MIKSNFPKLEQAFGLQRCPSKKDSISKGRNEKKIADHYHPLRTRTLLNSSNPTINSFNSADANYDSWVMEHPSALSLFDGMINTANGSIVVFLDYDGTLSPIVDDPDCAFMSDEMRSAVHEVAKSFPTAIISGRSRDKVYEFVQLTEVYYAGSHGMDIMCPPRLLKSSTGKYQSRVVDTEGNEMALFQPAKEFLPSIRKILKLLEVKTRNIEGVRIEDNRFCISVHYRQVQEEDYEILENKVKSILKGYPNFHLTNGKKVLEIRPSIKWDKGHALEYLLDTLGFGSSCNLVPLYIGDDRTDEDAFKAIKNRGQGYPIIVSSTPKDTKASYSLRDPAEVLAFLVRLARCSKAHLQTGH